jgi:hypothetical protein
VEYAIKQIANKRKKVCMLLRSWLYLSNKQEEEEEFDKVGLGDVVRR